MPLTPARQRGLYPEQGEPEYYDDTVAVTIKLPAWLWQWLEGTVGQHSWTYSVEATIVTALRCAAGPQANQGMTGAAFLVMAANCCNVSVAEATFGRMDPEAERQVGILMEAARAVSRGPASFAKAFDHDDDPPEMADVETAAVLKAWSAATGTDMTIVIEQERQRQDEEDRQLAEALAKNIEPWEAGQTRPLSEILDDDIPY